MRIVLVSVVATALAACGGCPAPLPTSTNANTSAADVIVVDQDVVVVEQNDNANESESADAIPASGGNSNTNSAPAPSSEDAIADPPPSTSNIDLVTLADWEVVYEDTGYTDCVAIRDGLILAYYPGCLNRSLPTSLQAFSPNNPRYVFGVTVGTIGRLSFDVREESDGSMIGFVSSDGNAAGRVTFVRK